MIVSRFLRWVDSESLRLPQAILYTGFALAGLYMSVMNRTPDVVNESTRSGFQLAWAILLVVCPLLVLIGFRLKNEYEYTGLLLQLYSNGCITMCLGAYGASLVAQDYLVKGTFALFCVVSLSVVTSVITLRDWRRIVLVNAVAKELDRRQDDT